MNMNINDLTITIDKIWLSKEKHVLESGLTFHLDKMIILIKEHLISFYLDEKGKFCDIECPDIWPCGREHMNRVFRALAEFPENKEAIQYWKDNKMVPYAFFLAVQDKLNHLKRSL